MRHVEVMGTIDAVGENYVVIRSVSSKVATMKMPRVISILLPPARGLPEFEMGQIIEAEGILEHHRAPLGPGGINSDETEYVMHSVCHPLGSITYRGMVYN
ncbi:hypothetical protein HDV00_001759 [Rhizophlyctis rosea]|nr:hypothetical protein HDV00_001759 [Rhizophlyctis rosea]